MRPWPPPSSTSAPAAWTLRRGSEPEPMPERARPSVSTGHPGLDAALAGGRGDTGGWPRGALALIDAPPGFRGTSLALGTLAAAQAAGGLVAWLDLDGTMDAAVAARLGVRLEWLLVARPARCGRGDRAGRVARTLGPHRCARPRPGRAGHAGSSRPGSPGVAAGPHRRHGGARAGAAGALGGRGGGRRAGDARSVLLAGGRS